MKNHQLGILLLLAATITAIPFALTAPTIKASSTKLFDIYQNNSTGGNLCSGHPFCFNSTSAGPTITVNQGDTVMITVHNNDSIIHTFTINTYVADSNYNPRQTQAVTPFVASTSGTFTYKCSIHPNDMFGTFKVNPAAPITPTSLLALIGTTTAAGYIVIKRRR